jgi:glutamate transport system permease protein
MTAARALFDEPGPRGRRRTRYATVVTLVVIAVAAIYAAMKFQQHGELAAARWRPFTQYAYIKFLWTGLAGTLRATAVGAVLAFPLGAMLAFMRVSRHAVVRWVGGIYVELFRTVPLLLLIFAFLLALPRYGFNPSIFWKLVLPIVIVSSAVLAEVFRAGIKAVNAGQSEAAAAIGLRPGQAMRLVVFPQAMRLVVPTLITQLASLLKDTTLGYVVSYPELMKQANNLTVFTHLLIQPYLIVAVVYVVIIFAISQVAVLAERRLGRRPTNPAAPASAGLTIGDDAADPDPQVLPVGPIH